MARSIDKHDWLHTADIRAGPDFCRIRNQSPGTRLKEPLYQSGDHISRDHHFVDDACLDLLDCDPGDWRCHRLFRTHPEIPRCSFMGGPAGWCKEAET